MPEDCKPYAVRVERLEERVDRMEQDLTVVKTEQAETRVYVKQIFERIDDLKDMIKSAGKNQTKNQTQWIEFAKWLIGGTIFIIVAYIFGGGGVQ